jgi:hypothetical protein
LAKQINGGGDTATKDTTLEGTKKKATETLKKTFGNLLKKKKETVGTTKIQSL